MITTSPITHIRVTSEINIIPINSDAEYLISYDDCSSLIQLQNLILRF